MERISLGMIRFTTKQQIYKLGVDKYDQVCFKQ